MARRKKHYHEEHAAGGHERWLVSYADMITLLFCLFLILYAMSKVNEQKFQVLSRSLATAIDKTPPKPQAPPDSPEASPSSNIVVPLAVPPDAPPADEQASSGESEDEMLQRLSDRLNEIAKARGWKNQLFVHKEEQGLVVTLAADGVMFETGEVEVRPGALPIILAVGNAIAPFPNLVRVEGHTDNVPLNGGPYKTNWGLSTMRATNVAEVLIRQARIDPRRFSVLGYGETRPAVPNDTDDHRQQNRRVEIMVLKRGDRPPTGGAK